MKFYIVGHCCEIRRVLPPSSLRSEVEKTEDEKKDFPTKRNDGFRRDGKRETEKKGSEADDIKLFTAESYSFS